MNPLFHHRFLPILFIGFIGPASAGADVIGLNFVRGSSGASPLAANSIAGVVPVGNWNNSTTVNADTETTGIPLLNDRGAATVATATWQSGAASWSVATAGTGSASDMLMMTGYLDQGGDGNGQVHTITVNNIPYAHYDVYLYHSSSGGPDRTARFQANGTNIYTRNLNPANTFNGFTRSGFPTLAEAANLGNPSGNYVRWEGLTGATLSIQGQGIGTADGGAGGNTRRAPIQGIQIVEVVLTQGLPEVENSAATSVGVNAATANGELIRNGQGADSATVTVYWGTTDGGTVPAAWSNTTTAGSFTSASSFSAALAGLAPNTTYFYRAFASNGAGSDWAPISITFTTRPLPELPEVENRPANPVGLNSATLNGELLGNGLGADSAAITIYWGTTDGATAAGAWANSAPAGARTSPGSFSAALTGLTPNTVYFYRAFASNTAGPDWAPTSASFATLRPPANAISLNFVRGTTGETALNPTDIAGVVGAGNWNNAPMANADSHANFPLVNDSGMALGATASWQSAGLSWSVATTGTGGAGNMKMMTGYLDQTGDGLNQIHTVTVNNIPYGTYDVYLYHSSADGPDRSARFRANATDLFTRNLSPANTFNGFVNDQHATLADSNNSPGGGNYVLWTKLSGTLTIEAQAIGATDGGYPGSGDTRRAPIQGIQIVAASPPKPFAITGIDYNRAGGKVTVTWNSVPGVNYGIDASATMVAEDQPGGWLEISDTQATETTSSFEHTLPVPTPEFLFYRIRRF